MTVNQAALHCECKRGHAGQSSASARRPSLPIDLHASEHRILVAEHQQLSNLGPVATEHRDSHAEYPACQQVDDLGQHRPATITALSLLAITHVSRAMEYSSGTGGGRHTFLKSSACAVRRGSASTRRAQTVRCALPTSRHSGSRGRAAGQPGRLAHARSCFRRQFEDHLHCPFPQLIGIWLPGYH